MSAEDLPGGGVAAVTPPPFIIMGIVNVTPDSFSDGGLRFDPQLAADAAWQLAAEGADLIDIGAESTRPGAADIAEEVEWQRLAPVLSALARRGLGVPISVDTRRPTLMLRAAETGASWINDVGGAADTATLARLAKFPGMNYVATHMHGTPQTMQQHPLAASEAVDAVASFFSEIERRADQAQLARRALWLDPGIGFGKDDGGNIALMQQLPAWRLQQRQLAVGVSRKGFVGRAVNIDAPRDRDAASKMLELGLVLAGATLIRTHAVSALARLRKLMTEGARVHHA